MDTHIKHIPADVNTYIQETYKHISAHICKDVNVKMFEDTHIFNICVNI